MSKHLRRDLDRLAREILSVGALVEEAIATATMALVQRREDLCREVFNGDQRINDKEVEVEEQCLKILALHQPVAADLRYIVAVLKVNNDLERMGDLAVNIAERAKHLARVEPIDMAAEFHEMVELTRFMVHRCLDALVERDTTLAREVIEDDNDVDEINRRMYRLAREHLRENPQLLDQALDLLSCSRNLERIADLATNVGQEVVFMVDGEVVRHQSS